MPHTVDTGHDPCPDGRARRSPHLRPRREARRAGLRAVLVPALLVGLVLGVLPALAVPSEAAGAHRSPAATRHARAEATRDHRLALQRAHARAERRAAHRAAVLRAERVRAARLRARLLGIPPERYAMPPGAYFSFPNRTPAQSTAIRDRVLHMVKSTWGGRRTGLGPRPTNGRIRMATWSFDDWGMARALYRAYRRGVSVQVVAAQDANADHRSWQWLRSKLGAHLYRPGLPASAPMASFARVCRGACRGPGGTPHSKYFLFDDVGARHAHDIVVQTSMNLTRMAYQGQWNQAQVVHSAAVFDDYARVFAQTRLGRPLAAPYHVAAFGNVVDVFFPRPRATAAGDPVMQMLDRVSCRGARVGGTARGSTRVRVNQYAIYGDRGVWIAKKLRYLYDHGCDVAIIYSISSRPVLSILRSTSGRGPVPMRQSVVKDAWGNLVKYNHSKWMVIAGHWGRSTSAYVTFSGSANWANLAFGDDEQMQRILARTTALSYLANFATTWRQRSSQRPGYSPMPAFGRIGTDLHLDQPAVAPDFGHGVFRYAEAD